MEQFFADIDGLVASINESAYLPTTELIQPPTALEITTDPLIGLSTIEVNSRLELHGLNTLSEEKQNLLKKYFKYFVGPVQTVMLSAAILAIGLGFYIDFAIILSILLLNATVAFVQDYQASSIVNALKESLALKAQVLRNGMVAEIDAKYLVPGDIVLVDHGTIVPGDAVILEGFLQVDQSTLTGESLVVDKFVNGVVYSSSVVKRGQAKLIISSTGDKTFFGKTAALARKTTVGGHFASVLSKIGKILLILVILFLLIVWVTGFFRSTGIVNILQNTLVITVIGVPVGLPAVVTTTMAVGAAKLAKKKAIVKNLSAIESLAGIDVLCSDKTGTLTMNRLTMEEPWLNNCTNEEILEVAALACSNTQKDMDAIDRAILGYLKDFSAVRESLKQYKLISFQPFDPVSKRVTSRVTNGVTEQECLKGSAHSVITHIELDEETTSKVSEKVEELAAKGYRCIAVAINVASEWRFLGLLPFYDPPREDAAAIIQEAKNLGLSIKMLTGDSVDIAQETARRLGLGTRILDSMTLTEFENKKNRATLTKEEYMRMKKLIEEADVFAQVFPSQKHFVVSILQECNHLVAMTGDGVNDAPSLKKADTGIAVEGATSAAQAASDIVLLKSGLLVIIETLKTSRMIFQRMRSYVIYRIALSLHLQVYLTLLIVILNRNLNVELVAFLAIFSDIATLSIAYDKATFSLSPSRWNLKQVWVFSAVLGVLLAVANWILTAVLLITPGIIQRRGNAQSVLFLSISLMQSWLIFVTRFSIPFNMVSLPSIILVVAVVTVDIVASLFALFGWFVEGEGCDIVTVISVWIYSAFVTIVLFLVFYAMSHSRLANLL